MADQTFQDCRNQGEDSGNLRAISSKTCATATFSHLRERNLLRPYRSSFYATWPNLPQSVRPFGVIWSVITEDGSAAPSLRWSRYPTGSPILAHDPGRYLHLDRSPARRRCFGKRRNSSGLPVRNSGSSDASATHKPRWKDVTLGRFHRARWVVPTIYMLCLHPNHCMLLA